MSVYYLYYYYKKNFSTTFLRNKILASISVRASSGSKKLVISYSMIY